MAKDHDMDKIAKFDTIYTKLMQDPNVERLDLKYAGHKRLAS